MSKPIRLLLADDHRHAREGMRTIVAGIPEFLVVGEASSGEEALAMTGSLLPDLILMDINMPGMGGFEAVKLIKSEYPFIKIIMVTVSDDVSHLFEALKKGAQGYLLKNLNPSSWRDYLRAVALDEAPLNPELAMSILREFASRKSTASATTKEKEQEAGGLTPREKEILQEVARGQKNREVAVSLGLSEHTVKNHIKNILQKLHLDNRVQLTRYAYERGMVETE
ncbi:response regulator [Cohnella herbarum]|uniref:Response regulator transcription factor n=1 Tax=Cohnella herbarum TaxID=2728023 RepID=A0A7Z2VQV7_9BACL|nr:response regulator transcription factor [Cohnella herbarum]QJD87549.1 response regulator transcription factor [Cohnella herbarum]